MVIIGITIVCVGRCVGRLTADISTPAKRARLDPRKNPYWIGLGGGRGGISLGYRRTTTGAGSWVSKVVIGGRRVEAVIGLADDLPALTGLSFRAASASAHEWSNQQARVIEARGAEAAPDPTVRTAVESYVATRAKRSDRSGDNAKGRMFRHVLGDQRFADTKLSKLRALTIESWRSRLPVRGQDEARDGERMAPATLNRLLSDVRAALNGAAERHRRELPAYLAAEIRIGTRKVPLEEPARKQLLTDDQVQRVILASLAADGDFGRFILLAAATGARFSQLARLTVGDLQPDAGRIMMPSSRKGRSSKARPPFPIPLSADVIERVRPCAQGREDNEPLLTRQGYRRGARIDWIPDRRIPWRIPNELDKLWAAISTEVKLPTGSIPYSLRHSSIVRMLVAGLPVRLVAALHDTSSAMVEAHYSRFIVDATGELARRVAMPFVDHA